MIAAVAAAVLALTLPATDVTIATQNVRVGLPPPRAQHDVRQAADHATIVLAQETRRLDAATLPPQHWGTAHLGGRSFRGDCSTYWDRATWSRLAAWTVPIAADPFPHGHRWALVTILRDRHRRTLAVVNVHLWTHTLDPSRRAAYSRSVGRVRALLDRLRIRYDAALVGGDWNRPYSRRVLLGRRWGTVEPPRPTGPKGGRPDYLRWTRADFRVVRTRVIGPTYSDHDGVEVSLRRR